ncbi:HEAT repeat domain-containing protein [Paenibacillus sp. GCM10028914]|uniref:HEAT repeat domain-containing protein n=1 Tax=Paenibacillus sp. GCM10028914 TaxID=3273416 RepID=UPI00361C57F2
MNNAILNLENEIISFKKWADGASVTYGEWETDYLHWDKIYSAVYGVLKHDRIDEWDAEVYELILYILARDNECENIIQTLIEHPRALKCLAHIALMNEDYEARWQVAYALGEIADPDNNLDELLRMFLQDKHEYVRRRASLAIEKRILMDL